MTCQLQKAAKGGRIQIVALCDFEAV